MTRDKGLSEVNKKAITAAAVWQRCSKSLINNFGLVFVIKLLQSGKLILCLDQQFWETLLTKSIMAQDTTPR